MHEHKLDQIEITKGKRVISINQFCKDIKCKYEQDLPKIIK